MNSHLIPTPTKGLMFVKPFSRGMADVVMAGEVVSIHRDSGFALGQTVYYQGAIARKFNDGLVYIEEDQIIGTHSHMQTERIKNEIESVNG